MDTDVDIADIMIWVEFGYIMVYTLIKDLTYEVYIFPECVARVPVSLGGLGVWLCSPSFAFATATVGNRRQPFA